MSRHLHPIAGGLALAIIATFWLTTLWAELIGPPRALVAVKTLIPWGFLLLIPVLAAAGGTGQAMASGKSSGLIGAKQRRMRLAAANGLLVLMPTALILSAMARAGRIDATFYALQALELAAGAANLFLLGMNMRDGRRMTRARRARRQP